MAKRSQKTSEQVVLRGGTESGAIFDERGKFRYLLWRNWDEDLPVLGFVMLNPSTADDVHNDPTIERCVRFAARWNFGSVRVANAFALRSTHTDSLYRARDPVGPLNDEYIKQTARGCDRVVVAWGNHGLLQERHAVVVSLLQAHLPELWCFGKTRLGQPRHPLYVRNDAPLMRF